MNPLQLRLAALRRRLRLVTTFRGGCFSLAALVGGLALACLLDSVLYWGCGLDLPSLFRALLLVGTLTGVGIVAYRALLRPLGMPTDDLSLALRVEEQYPVLNDALASTIEFLQHPPEDPQAVSMPMRREAIGRAIRLAQSCDFNKAVNTRGVRVAGASLFLAALLALLLLWRPATAGTALARIADPFGGHVWERHEAQTQLVLYYPRRIAVGQKFSIKGEVRGVVPDHATIEFKDLSPSPQDFRIKANEDGTTGTLNAPIDMTQQKRDFRFRVKANDADSGWHSVELRQPPKLMPLAGKPSPQLELHYPAYTDLRSPEKFAPGSGRIETVTGTHVRFRAATDRPIAAAWIEFRPLPEVLTHAAHLALLGSCHVPDALGLAAGGHAVWGKVHGNVLSGGKEFVIDFRPCVKGTYQLTIQDHEGLTASHEYDLLVEPDPVPLVTIERPASKQTVLPRAEVAFKVLVSDEIFAVRSVYLEYRRKDRQGRWLDEQPQRLPLYDHRVMGTALPPLLSVLSGAPVPAPLAPLRLRPKRLPIEMRWSLEGLVSEGEVLVVQACAEDFNDLAPFAQVGRSHEIELHVVGRAAFLAEVEKAQGQFEQDLAAVRKRQEEALARVKDAEQHWRTTGKLRPEDVQGIVEAEQLQKDIQDRVGAKADEGLRGELARLQDLLRDNKLPPTATHERIKVMKDELDRLAREHLPLIEPRLNEARRELESKANPQPDPNPAVQRPGGNELGKAREHQEEVKKALDDLLGYLQKWSDTQAVKDEMRSVLKEQSDQYEELERLKMEIDKTVGNKLSPEQQAAVRRLGEQQQRLAERTQKLLEELERVAVEKEGKEPGSGEMLRKAAELGRFELLPDHMKETAEHIYDRKRHLKDPKKFPPPQVIRALMEQNYTIDVLEKMLRTLEEEREQTLERLTKRQREEQKKLGEMADQLEKLQKKVKDALQIPDEGKRKEELQRLAQEQHRLQEEVEKKARELSRLEAPRAARQLDQAADKMDRAAKRLDQGENPEDDQKEALERLKVAQEKLKEARQQAEEELARERLARLADHIKGIKQRQEAAREEAERLHRTMLQNGRWTRDLLTSLSMLVKTQDVIKKDTAALQEKIKGAAVFEMIVGKTVSAMDTAAKSIQKRWHKGKTRQGPNPLLKEDVADENQADQDIQKAQNEASRRLQRLLDALKQEPGIAQGPKKDGAGDGGNGGGGGGGKGVPGDSIPPLAQLKALKAEQQEVNDRTTEFAERHPNLDNLGEAARAELEAMRRDQEKLFELFRKMAASASPPGGNP